MSFVLFVLLFIGINRSAEGTFDFTQKPKGTVYFVEGTDAVFEWKYSVDSKATEFASVIWKVVLGGLYITLIFEKENGDLEDGPQIPAAYDGRVEKKGQASLVIKNITFNDSVVFQCILLDKSGTQTSNSVKLVVTGKAFVDPSVQFAKVGGSVSFICNATAVPSQNFTWWRDYGQTKSKLIDNGRNVTIRSFSGSSELVLSNIGDGGGGHYFCDATANINQPNFIYFYQQLPEFQSSCPVKDYSSSIGNNLTIDCPLSGFPPPTVTWKKNGTLLQKGGSTKLTITSVKEDDFGIYTCTATNFETSAGPCYISVVKETAEISLMCSDGTPQKPAKVEWSPQVGAKYYVLKTAGDDVRDDLVIGTITSLEIHYHALVMKKADEKLEEMEVRVYWSAMGGERVLAKAACELTLKRPNDVEY